MDDDLIAAHGEVPALMPFLHLPVQSGLGPVLKAMNRGHTADDYRASWSGCAPRGRTSRCPPTSSPATPARPRPTTRRPWR
jgi:hypothetical protein